MMRLINPQSSFARLSRSERLVGVGWLIVFILVALVSTLENALAVSVSLGVLAAVVQTKWDRRRDPRMWVLIGIIAAVQLPAIFLVHIPRLSAGLVCLPFAFIEGFALLGLLNWIERRFPRS